MDSLRSRQGSCARCPLRSGSEVRLPFGRETSRTLICLERPAPETERLFLEKMLRSASIEGYLLTHLVRCGDRPPKASEIAKCKPWLWEELQLVKPKLVVTVGAVPTRVLLKDERPFAEVAGKVHEVAYTDALILPIPCLHTLLEGKLKVVNAWVRILKVFSSLR